MEQLGLLLEVLESFFLLIKFMHISRKLLNLNVMLTYGPEYLLLSIYLTYTHECLCVQKGTHKNVCSRQKKKKNSQTVE